MGGELGELVPFGKHKGQPVEVLMADRGYSEWLLAQPWFRDRYATIYQTVVNYGGEPQESPEHNQMQAGFLDDGRCLALGRLVCPAGLFDGSEASRVFARAHHHGEPPCVCDHEKDCPGSSECRGGDHKYGCQHRHSERFAPTFEWWQTASSAEKSRVRSSFRTYDHCNPDCPWRDDVAAGWLLDSWERVYEPVGQTMRVEVKPDLGDDFPAVLRQVTRYHNDDGDWLCVVARRHRFEHVTWDQVSQMFAASRVVLVDEQQLFEVEHETAACEEL